MIKYGSIFRKNQGSSFCDLEKVWFNRLHCSLTETTILRRGFRRDDFPQKSFKIPYSATFFSSRLNCSYSLALTFKPLVIDLINTFLKLFSCYKTDRHNWTIIKLYHVDYKSYETYEIAAWTSFINSSTVPHHFNENFLAKSTPQVWWGRVDSRRSPLRRCCTNYSYYTPLSEQIEGSCK